MWVCLGPQCPTLWFLMAALLDTYLILWTGVTPIQLIKKRKYRKTAVFLLLHCLLLNTAGRVMRTLHFPRSLIVKNSVEQSFKRKRTNKTNRLVDPQSKQMVARGMGEMQGSKKHRRAQGVSQLHCNNCATL